jgi:hypothetical protein
MYKSSIERALEHHDGLIEGGYFGDLYVFAANYGMEHFRYVILEELDDRNDLRLLLDAAMTVYSVLRRETLFSLSFKAHIVEKIIFRSQKCHFAAGEEMDDLDVADIMAMVGDLVRNLTEASLSAMLIEKLSSNPIGHEIVVPPSQGNACSYFRDRPHVRNATGIALQ